jgi:hypothetical protein
MNFNKTFRYLILNTLAFFAIIGIGALCGKYFHWASTAHDLGLGNLFMSVLFALVIPLTVSFFIVKRKLVDVQYVFTLHVILTIIYLFIWMSIFL